METTLQKNIDRYMDQKGMAYYTDLLIAIAKVQGLKQDKAIEFANKEKSNLLSNVQSRTFDVPKAKIV